MRNHKFLFPCLIKVTSSIKTTELILLVENEIIIELKTCEALLPVHSAQIISYLKLANKQMGFLVNFNVR